MYVLSAAKSKKLHIRTRSSQKQFHLLTRLLSFLSSSFLILAYTLTIHSAAPFVKTGAGLLFAYCMYFFMNGTLKISTFFVAFRRDEDEEPSLKPM